MVAGSVWDYIRINLINYFSFQRSPDETEASICSLADEESVQSTHAVKVMNILSNFIFHPEQRRQLSQDTAAQSSQNDNHK